MPAVEKQILKLKDWNTIWNTIELLFTLHLPKLDT